MIDLIKPLVIWMVPADHTFARFDDLRKIQTHFTYVGQSANRRAIYIATLKPAKDILFLRRTRGLSKKYRVYVAPPIKGFMPPAEFPEQPEIYVGLGVRKD